MCKHDKMHGGLRTTSLFKNELWEIMREYVRQGQYVDERLLSQLPDHLITNLGFGKQEGSKVRFLADYLINEATIIGETMSMRGLQGVIDIIRMAAEH